MTDAQDAMAAAQHSIQEGMWRQHQANALAQQQTAARLSPCAGLGDFGGGLGGLLGGGPFCSPSPPPHPGIDPGIAYTQDRLRNQKARKAAARIGKVTPKPGYIRDFSHPDGVRAKVPADYTLWQRLYIRWMLWE